MKLSDFVKRWRKGRLQFEIDLTNEEIGKLEDTALALELSIETQESLVMNLNTLVSQLQDLLDRLGDVLGEVFRQSILAQIASAVASIDALTKSINEATIERDKFLSDAEGLRAFVVELEELKKKSEDDDGITVSSFIVNNENGGETMEISLDKDGNAKVSKIANARGEPLARKVQWFYEGDDIGTLTPSEDTLSCNFKSNDMAGSGQLFAKVGKTSDEDAELVESNRIEVKGSQKPDTAVAEFLIEEVL